MLKVTDIAFIGYSVLQVMTPQEVFLKDGLTNEPEGDIDVLLVPPNHPDFSTAIQIKRLR